MAKKIKVILCPQCGSGQQSEIKQDHYKCGSCGTEYFLDNDDINVNVRHQYTRNEPKPADPAMVKKVLIGAIGIVLVFIILIIISNSDSSTSVINESVHDSFSGSTMAHSSSKPIALSLSKKTFRKGYQDTEDSRNGYYFSFYDLENNATIKDTKLENISFTTSSSDHFKARYFESINKNLVILNKSNLFEVDFEKHTFNDITADLLSRHSEFNVGIASIEFEYYTNGEGYKILTNTGKNLIYYPATNTLTNSSDRSYNREPNNDELNERTSYIFTKQSSDFPDIPIQLLKIKYLHHTKGKNTKPNYIKWEKDWRSNNKNMKMLGYNRSTTNLESYEDFTPDRLYFEPAVLYQTDKTLLIKYKPTPAQDTQTLFQLLDIKTKEPIGTKKASTKDNFSYINDQNIGLTDNYFVIYHNYINYVLIPIKDGELVKVRLDGRDIKE